MGLGFIFAGCGGTFWTATPILAALVKKYKPDLCAFVDPDILEAHNLQRQWVNADAGQSKVTVARFAVMGEAAEHGSIASVNRFPEGGGQQFDGMDVIVITNVDSNAARLDIRNWCRRRPGFSAMIVSGCDKTYGQVYTGIWHNQDALVDWGEWHPEMESPTSPANTCGQNIMSNAQTGVYLGWALMDVMEQYLGGGDAREYYWSRDQGTSCLKGWMETIPMKVSVLR